jgi:hypothetical protein
VFRVFNSSLGAIIIAFTFGSVPWAAADPAAYTYVRTESGRVRCVINVDWVTCESSGPENSGFLQAPSSGTPGVQMHNVKVTAPGAFQWMDGNIGGTDPGNDTILHYGSTLELQGWTILPNSDGTRFTNDGTGHGMFVSIENVSSF